MYLFVSFILLLLILALLLTLIPMKLSFSMKLDELPKFKLNASWLSSFITAKLLHENKKLILKVFILNSKVFTKNINFKNNSSSNNNNFLPSNDILLAIKNSHIHMSTFYGFEDPSITGMLCGTIGLIAQYLNFDFFTNNPDFNTTHNYINANAKVSPLFLILNILKSKKRHTTMHSLHYSK